MTLSLVCLFTPAGSKGPVTLTAVCLFTLGGSEGPVTPTPVCSQAPAVSHLVSRMGLQQTAELLSHIFSLDLSGPVCGQIVILPLVVKGFQKPDRNFSFR